MIFENNQDRRMYYYSNLEEELTKLMLAADLDQVQEYLIRATRELNKLVKTVEDKVKLNRFKIELRERRLKEHENSSRINL